MKKKILSAVLALAMVLGLFGGMQKDAQAAYGYERIFTEGNLDTKGLGDYSSVTGRAFLEYEEIPWMPGEVIMPGTKIEGYYTELCFMKAPLTISMSENSWMYRHSEVTEFITDLEITYMDSNSIQCQTYSPERSGYIQKFIDTPAGYDAWKLQVSYLARRLYHFFYPVKLAPDTRDCELTSQNGTTTWKDYYGKTVWTITEKEDAITADLSDWAAIPDAIVKAWKESGKAINLSYLWKGYNVSLSIPAGEIARTGEDWYGAEYIAKVNEQYVTVKDWFGQIVSTDVLY